MRTMIFISLLVMVTGLKSQNDTTLCNNLIAKIEAETNQALAEKYNEELLALANKCNSKKHLASAYNNKGAFLAYKGDVIGGLEQFSRGLKIQKEIGDKKDVCTSLDNIGELYSQMGEYKKAIEYFNESLDMQKVIGDKKEVAFTLFLIAKSYSNFDPAKSLIYSKEAIKIQQELSDKYGEAQSTSAIAYAQEKQGDYKSALSNYLKCLEMFELINYEAGVSSAKNNIGHLYFTQGNNSKALEYSISALELSKKQNKPWGIRNSAKTLYDIYQVTNKPAQALEMYQLYIKMRDSISNQQTRKAVIQKQYQIQYEKKALADSLRVSDERKIAAIEIEKQQTQKAGLYIGLALVAIFAGVVFNRFRVTQKQKTVIEHHQKEITDSITYAKRLQEAILPTEQQFKELLSDSFVLYKPKDIVAGDFYWLENVGDTVFFAAADCTGHGVPGAMVSMVCSNALTRVVLEYGITEPGKILDEVRKIVVSTFEKSGSDIKDGMDISVCALNKNTNELKWAGANNPLWYLQDGKINEVKADKQPIGKCDNPKPFTTHSVLLQKGDSVFIFTDGYADQFGGAKGKKFKYKQLETVLLNGATDGIEKGYSAPSMFKQRTNLSWAFDAWKGELEQVDDVCVIGVRI